MRLRVLFFVITLSFLISVVRANQSVNKRSSKGSSSQIKIKPLSGEYSSPDETGRQESNSSVDQISTAENSPEKSSSRVTRYTRGLSSPEECARTCVRGENPKTCYYHFTVENYGTLTRACNLCRTDPTRLTADCQCITADGYEMSGLKVVNRMFPGPSIMVCLNDYVVIDVDNRVHGAGTTIHWHGIFQNGYQYYDGVPYVTQCPIEEGTTFRYQWRAKNSGTHFWHSHSGLQKSDGMDGAIIVREPKTNEPNNNLWDADEIDNVIFVADWFHDSSDAHFPGNYVRNPLHLPDNYLINGMGQWTVGSWFFVQSKDPSTGNTTTSPLATFTVTYGKRFRFRLINSCNLNCPIQMTIQGHDLTIIATDGEPVQPVTVNSISSFSAERYDFVLSADQAPGNYWIQFRSLAECEPYKLQQLAILRYKSAKVGKPALRKPSYEAPLQEGVVLNRINVRCDGSPESRNTVCVSQLKSARPVPERILQKEPDVRIFLPFGFYDYKVEEVFKPGTYSPFTVPTASGEVVPLVGKNATNVLPPVALISQRNQISNEQFCTTEKLPGRCSGKTPCPCTLMEKIPLNSVVEVILIDEAHIDGVSHPFHLHGTSFYVIGEGVGEEYNISRINLARTKALDSRGMLPRSFENPPAKDTYAVFNNGYSIIRFLADNPGYWFFHCHFEFHLAVGMAAVFQIGEQSDLPPIPDGFPVCGNFIPPIDDRNW